MDEIGFSPQLARSLASVLEPHRQLQRQLARALEPQRQLQKAVENALAPQREISELVAQLQKPFFDVQLIKGLSLESHFQKQQEQFQRALAPQREIQRLISGLSSPKVELLKQFESLSSIIDQAHSTQIEPISEGVVRVNEEIVVVSEVAAEIESVAEDIAEETGLTALAALLRWLNQLPSAVKVVAFLILIPHWNSVFSNLTTPLYEQWWLELREATLRDTNKAIVREANDIYEANELKPYRFVSASRLNVRLEASSKSQIVGQLENGKVVLLVKRENSWCLVEYFDHESNEHAQGWVFSRYLRSFKK